MGELSLYPEGVSFEISLSSRTYFLFVQPVTERKGSQNGSHLELSIFYDVDYLDIYIMTILELDWKKAARSNHTLLSSQNSLHIHSRFQED